MSFKPEVVTDNSGTWNSNALRFATEAEALASAQALMDRWTLVRNCRATECDDPVEHVLVNGELTYVTQTTAAAVA